MGLATPVDRTPTSAPAAEARWFALPAAIKDKHARLEARQDTAHGALEALRGQIDRRRADLSEKRSRLERDIANGAPSQTLGVVGADPWTGGGGAGVTTVGGGLRPERQQEVDRLAEDLTRLEGLYRLAEARWESAARTYQAVREWLERTPIAEVVPVVVRYERVADPRVELGAIREEIAALELEGEAIASAPVPRAEALARLDEAHASVAKKVAARRAGAVPAFFSPHGVSDVSRLGVVDGFGGVARELEQAIREAAEERFLATVAEWRKAIEAYPENGTPAISSADRPKRLAAIARKRADLERREEHIILAAERDDMELDRRADASTAIALCTVLADDAAA